VENSDLNYKSLANTSEGQSERTDASEPSKKKFVTPEISMPVNVLEATTFFQSADSGALP